MARTDEAEDGHLFGALTRRLANDGGSPHGALIQHNIERGTIIRLGTLFIDRGSQRGLHGAAGTDITTVT